MKNWQLIVIFVSVFLLYGNTLNHGFVLDDFSAIPENRIVKKGFDGLSEIFTTHYRKGYWSNPGDLYRPLVLASFATEVEFNGLDTWLFHFNNLLLYALLGVAIYLLLSKLLVNYNKALPVVITMLYVFHPIHTEVVANIKSRDEILSFLFIILSLHAYLKFTVSKQIVPLLLAAICMFLALLSKESSVLFLLIIPFVGYFFYDLDKKNIIKTIGVLSVPVVLFLVMRSNALSGQSEVTLSNSSFTFLTSNPVDAFIKSGYHLWLYMYKMVVPINLSSSYPEFATGLTSNVYLLGIAGLIIHLLLLILGIKLTIKKNLFGFAIMFYLVSHFLHSNLFFIIGTNFGERLLFGPSLGFCIVIGYSIVKLVENKPSNVLKIAIAVILIGYSSLTYARNKVWESNLSLYKADVANQPNCANLNYWYGLELTKQTTINKQSAQKRKTSLQKGLKYFETALKLDPKKNDAVAQIALSYYKLGDRDESLIYYNKALADGRGGVEMLNNVAAIYFGNQQFEKAQTYYEQAIKINPYFVDAIGNLGVTLAQQGKAAESEQYFKKAIELAPNNAQYYFYLGMTLNQLGRGEEAKFNFEKAFELNPNLRR